MFQQSYPMRHKEVHFLHIPPALKYVYDFARSRFSPKMRERCMVSVVACALAVQQRSDQTVQAQIHTSLVVLKSVFVFVSADFIVDSSHFDG